MNTAAQHPLGNFYIAKRRLDGGDPHTMLQPLHHTITALPAAQMVLAAHITALVVEGFQRMEAFDGDSKIRLWHAAKGIDLQVWLYQEAPQTDFRREWEQVFARRLPR